MDQLLVQSRLFKALYFSLYAAFGVLQPYLSVFFASRSFSKPIIGMLQAIPNVACMIVGPFISSRADATQSHWETMIVSTLVGALTTMMMLYSGTSVALMAIFVVLGAVIRAPLTSLFDSCVISSLPDSSHFGEYRLYGAASFGILSLAGGLMLGSESPTSSSASASASASASDAAAKTGESSLTISDASAGVTASSFAAIFYVNMACCFITALLMVKVRSLRRGSTGGKGSGGVPAGATYDKLPAASRHEESAVSDDNEPTSQLPVAAAASSSSSPAAAAVTQQPVFSQVLSKFRAEWVGVTCFAFVVFASGISDGVIDAFLFVRLSELGGTGILMGMGRCITCCAEVVVFQFAGGLYHRLGVWRCLAFTSLAFVVRFSCYVLLTRDTIWWVLAVESLNGFTFAMSWQVSCMYAQQISPEGCEATVQSLLESLHWGLGSGLGALVAGFVYHQFGAVVLFSLAALLSAVALAVAALSAAFLALPVDDKASATGADKGDGEGDGKGKGKGKGKSGSVSAPGAANDITNTATIANPLQSAFTIVSSEDDDEAEAEAEGEGGEGSDCNQHRADVEMIRL